MKIHEFTTRGESGEVYQEFTLSFPTREAAQKMLDSRRAALEEAAGIAEDAADLMKPEAADGARAAALIIRAAAKEER